MPEGEQHRPFTEAFNAWFASAVDLHYIITVEASAECDAVDVSFLIGDGALQGCAHRAGISIAAMRDGECWDFLFDEDVVAETGAEGWFCSLCPPRDRPHFLTIETLWVAHLFEPLREWIDAKLRPAAVLEFCNEGGATSARLVANSSAGDQKIGLLRAVNL